MRGGRRNGGKNQGAGARGKDGRGAQGEESSPKVLEKLELSFAREMTTSSFASIPCGSPRTAG